MRRFRDRLATRIAGLLVITVLVVSATMTFVVFRVGRYDPGKLQRVVV